MGYPDAVHSTNTAFRLLLGVPFRSLFASSLERVTVFRTILRNIRLWAAGLHGLPRARE